MFKKAVFKKGLALGLLLFALSAFAFVYPPSFQVLMKSILAPAMFSVYSKDMGMLYCQLYGVASIEKAFQSDMCEITPKAAREMRHFAMQYTRNTIFLEEHYRAGYKKGWCFLQNGAHLFNAQIIRSGYGVVQYFDKSESAILGELEVLEALARENRRGLWNGWEKEMDCLKRTLKTIAQEALANEEENAENADNAENAGQNPQP